jgi:hypothetical protein
MWEAGFRAGKALAATQHETEIERLREANANNLAAWTNEVGHLYAKIHKQDAIIQRVRNLRVHTFRDNPGGDVAALGQRHAVVLKVDLDAALDGGDRMPACPYCRVLAKERDEASAERDRLKEQVARVGSCAQCGGFWLDRACGPTHAAVQAVAEHPVEVYAERGELHAEVERLASFIMDEIPGEPSQSEGAVDCAIRLLRDQAAAVQRVRDRHQKRTTATGFDFCSHCWELGRNGYAEWPCETIQDLDGETDG